MHKMTRKCFLGAVFLAFIWSLCLSMNAETGAAERGIKKYQPSAFMVVQGKFRNAIIASKKRFLLSPRTRIFDKTGEEMDIAELPVPCKAIIEYQPFSYRDPIALKIVVREIFPDATTDWTMPSPE